jgi:hypothetical protein
VKSSDWLRSGFFFLSFHFSKHVITASVLLGALLTLPALPLLWGASAAHVSIGFKILLLGKILLFGFMGALVPFFVARLGSLFLFPNLEPSVQLLTSIGIFSLTSVLNILSAIAENPVLTSEFHNLGFLVTGGGSSYRAILLIIWICVFGVAAIRKIREPFSSTLRLTRAMSFVVAIIAVLIVDWRISSFYRHVAPENRDANIVHEMTIMVPHLKLEDLDSILSSPKLDDWKANLRLSSQVLPSSESELAQIVSLLSGMQPWNHGIRKDYLNEDEQVTLSEHLSGVFSNKDSGNTRIFTLGTASPVADILGGSLAQLCNLNPETTLAIRAAEKLLIAYSQIPDRAVPFLFPESQCTQKLAPLSRLALHELLRFGRLFSTKQRVRSLWWIDPATGNNEAPEELAKRRLTSLRNTFSAIDAHLDLLDLRRNTRIQILGLGKRTHGAFAVISEEPAASLSTLPVVANGAFPLITSGQAASILRNAALDPQIPAYSEEPQWEHIPPSDSEESRAAFYAKRTLLCSWKTPTGPLNGEFVIKPAESGFSTTTNPLNSFSILAPVKDSFSECAKMAHETFETIYKSDISLSNRQPILHLYNEFISPASWADPSAAQPETTPAGKESVQK